MTRLNQVLLFSGAQFLLFAFSLCIGVLSFTLAPLIVSVIQIPLNIWIFLRKNEKIKFWKFVGTIQILNVFICIVLIALIQIFGRRYFVLFLDIDAWHW